MCEKKRFKIFLQNSSLSFMPTSKKPFHFSTLSWFWSACHEAVKHQLKQKLSDAHETPLFLI